MLGIFGLFGKSKPLAALEAELREAGLQPRLLHDSIKLTVLRLLPDRDEAARPDELRHITISRVVRAKRMAEKWQFKT